MMRRSIWVAVLLLSLALCVTPAGAQTPEERYANPDLDLGEEGSPAISESAADGEVTEIAIFTLKENSDLNFSDILAAARTKMNDLPGLIQVEFLQSSSIPHQYTQIVRWENLEAAKRAGEQAAATPEIKALLDAVNGVQLDYYRSMN